MHRKVIKVGTSAGVILPKEALKERNIHVGDMVNVEFMKGRAYSQATNARIDPQILKYAEECLEEYKDLLKMLADA